MSWSFHIKNGDLSRRNGRLDVVTGPQKLIQDLKIWILTPRGTDPMHLDYGSSIDGVVTQDRSFAETNIGGNANKETLMDIESELRRILLAYQHQQISRMRRDIQQYDGKNTFSNGEILTKIIDVEVKAVEDLVLAKITIQTDSGNVLSFVQPIG